MDKEDTICPECGKCIGTQNKRIKYHKIKVILSAGNKVKVKCPGAGRKVV
jgi:endogenous inhibitor of DNA gyrase (YacG/DUF329 family)